MQFRLHTLALAVLLTLNTTAFATTHQHASKSAPVVQSATAAEQALDALAEEYYEKLARLNPLQATEDGDSRFDDQLTMTIAPAERARLFALYRDSAARLHKIQRQALSEHARINYDCLDYEIKTALALEKFPDYLLPINQMDSVPLTLANYAGGQGAQPLQTPAQYDAYLRRILLMPDWIDQAIANMREGMRRHIVQPKALIVSALPQFEQLVTADAQSNIFYTPVRHFPDGFSDAEQTRLRTAYAAAIQEKILPALTRLRDFLSQEYLPEGRASSGWSALPNGKAWYQADITAQTTTHMQPEAIHQLGLLEVARIQSELGKLAPALGYQGDQKNLLSWMMQQKKYFPFTSEEQILDTYRKLNQKVMAQLPMLFGRMPKAPLDIRPEPEISRATASDHYGSPAVDGSRPGVFWTVINDPKEYELTGMTSLFLHEGQPGHHFHLALMQEMDLPKFRKFGGNNAYIEGWALYAETLGKEMHLYDDPETYAGHLAAEMLRATRLVVDTGMHAKGWTREQSIQYLRETLGYNEADAKNATERYMAWPAQALGYKLGQLKILELRFRAKAALGEHFDLRAFNDAILSDGTLPLDLLEQKMQRWIDAQKLAH